MGKSEIMLMQGVSNKERNSDRKLLRKAFLFLFLVVAMGAFSTPAHAQATGTVVFDSIPNSPTPPNVPSTGFQCCQNAELGDQVTLEADTPRRAGLVTVLMSSWSLHSDYPDMPAAGYTHPITLNIYRNATEAAAHKPWKTVTQEFTIPWRPEADTTCGTAYLTKGKCYNGRAFPIVFDLRSNNVRLPGTFIYGVAYNTNTWGYAPIGQPGPYESLNVGLATVAPTVGTDTVPGDVYRSSLNGAGGFISEGGWSSYTPAVQFTTFGFPVQPNDCKNGAWQNLLRTDNTSFKNQAACVTYVTSGK